MQTLKIHIMINLLDHSTITGKMRIENYFHSISEQISPKQSTATQTSNPADEDGPPLQHSPKPLEPHDIDGSSNDSSILGPRATMNEWDMFELPPLWHKTFC